MSYRETVTLQIGHYANHIGAHFWNIQESSFVYNPNQLTDRKEVCHDVLFREGINPRKEVTFTPRLVAFDLKGSLKTLKQEGSLYDKVHEEDEVQWLGDVTMHREMPAVKNAFLKKLEEEGGYVDVDVEEDDADKETNDDKEEEETGKRKRKQEDISSTSRETKNPSTPDMNASVTTWSDFLRTQYHPKSIHIVDEYQHLDELRPFNLFNCADEIFSNYDKTCEWEDRIRRFVEECDHLQGFQILMDTHDGFGGFGAGVLNYLEDEYPSKGILTFGFTPSHILDNTAETRSQRIINSALAYDKASTHSSLFVPASLATGLWKTIGPPIQFPYLTYEQLAFQTSAILASAIETVSLPYRLEAGACHVKDITHTFNAQGRKLASLHASIPFGLQEKESLVDYFNNLGDKFPWMPLTPHVKNENIPIMQSVVLRGIKPEQVKSKMDPRKLQDHLTGCETVKDTLEKYLDKKCPKSLIAQTCLESAQKITVPYPHIFSEDISKKGLVSSRKRREKDMVEEMPMITSLQCNSEMGMVVDQLFNAAAKMNIKKHHRYLELGLEEDDFTDVLDNLKMLASNYNMETCDL